MYHILGNTGEKWGKVGKSEDRKVGKSGENKEKWGSNNGEKWGKVRKSGGK